MYHIISFYACYVTLDVFRMIPRRSGSKIHTDYMEFKAS